MRNLVSLMLLIVISSCSPKEDSTTNIQLEEWADYVETRDSLHPYYVEGSGYTTFERWMWDEGFPDTIIVKFTRNGKFEMYVEAYRYGALEDSLGNYYSPAYAFISGVGDIWIYDIKGKFIKFIENDLPHSDMGHTYNP